MIVCHITTKTAPSIRSSQVWCSEKLIRTLDKEHITKKFTPTKQETAEDNISLKDRLSKRTLQVSGVFQF